MVQPPVRNFFGAFTTIAVSVSTMSGCGGGGGSGGGDTLPGVVLVSFLQSGQDNVPLNRTLTFDFSSAIDPASVDPDSIQIREGATFGLAVDGKYIVQGSRVMFEPRLPGRCDLSDSGLQPDTDYKVTLVGAPEEFAVRNLAGEALAETVVASFHTRIDTDPELFEDQQPSLGAVVLSTSPLNLAASVAVSQANRVVLTFSENLDPCTVNESTILFHQYATGDPLLGFDPAADQTPGDPFSWGSGAATSPARRVRCNVILMQDTLQTVVMLRPVFGEFPDNALLVVQVTAGVRDFGGLPTTPITFSFTTENRPTQTGVFRMEFDGDVPINENASTAEVDTARAPSKAQGFLLFAGDGDNGTNLALPTGPDTSRGPPGCTVAGVGVPQGNDGIPDDFVATPGDWVLDTGASRNTCLNSTDGSTAVIFEYRTFRIQTGATVRLVGLNPAILLVQGDVLIEAGGRLLAKGDNSGPTPKQGNGGNGVGYPSSSNASIFGAGGTGVAGGGDGGHGRNQGTAGTPSGGFYSENGQGGYGSIGHGVAKELGGGPAPAAGDGRGHGAVATQMSSSALVTQVSPGGGGGGHVADGGNGEVKGTNSGNRTLQNAFADGVGGKAYGDAAVNPASGIIMQLPEAGSGGGGGGDSPGMPFTTSAFAHGTGGGGGAGGGFVDITSKSDIRILGTIDASGGRGGNGAAGFESGGGGGGGGSGGGVRLLTPGMIVVDSTTVIQVGGGAAGAGAQGGNTQAGIANAGGMGSNGRLALETADSLLTKATPGATPTFTPAEGASGFSRYAFHGARFQGGGLQPVAITEVLDVGPYAPTFLVPDQEYALPPVPAPDTPRTDFVAGIPSVASRGIGKAGIFLEAKGFLSNPDGSVNLGSDSGWKSVGYFTDSGSESFPTWVPSAKPPVLDVPILPPGNTGNGITLLDGRQYLQVRITFFLPANFGPFDPGPYIDSWNLYFQYDQ